MTKLRPSILSIAGFDPSGGAGVLADIKTFEANNVYGLGVLSALTFQNDIAFEKVEWIPIEKIIEQIAVVQKRFEFDYVKIGLTENLTILNNLIANLKSQISNLKIIWDPILKSSSGFEFHNEVNRYLLECICKNIFIVTPNFDEIKLITGEQDAKKAAKELSKYCNVFLKGGHNSNDLGRDFLFTTEGKEFSFRPKIEVKYNKHGSGCVLSSAIAACLSKGYKLHRACLTAKQYTAQFLNSNKTLSGFHKI